MELIIYDHTFRHIIIAQHGFNTLLEDANFGDTVSASDYFGNIALYGGPHCIYKMAILVRIYQIAIGNSIFDFPVRKLLLH